MTNGLSQLADVIASARNLGGELRPQWDDHSMGSVTERFGRKMMGPKEDVQDPFERIDAATAKQMIEKGSVVVVDVREPAEWSQGHIPSAVHIPLGTLMNRPRELLQQDRIIFVCAEGVRSAVACEVAAAIGRKQLYNLEGGTIAWWKQGYPLVK